MKHMFCHMKPYNGIFFFNNLCIRHHTIHYHSACLTGECIEPINSFFYLLLLHVFSWLVITITYWQTKYYAASTCFSIVHQKEIDFFLDIIMFGYLRAFQMMTYIRIWMDPYESRFNGRNHLKMVLISCSATYRLMRKCFMLLLYCALNKKASRICYSIKFNANKEKNRTTKRTKDYGNWFRNFDIAREYWRYISV